MTTIVHASPRPLSLALFVIDLWSPHGWVFWPVDYTYAYPSDLSSVAKSQYIAAIADAYAASPGDPTALNTARMRLLDVSPSDIEAASLYFAGTITSASGGTEASSADSDPLYQQYLRTDGNIRITTSIGWPRILLLHLIQPSN